MRRILFSTICTLTFAMACTITACKSNYITPLEAAPVVSFKTDIQPTLVANCSQSGCHGNVTPASVPLITYSDISLQTAPGNPHGSTLYKTIIATSGKLMQTHTNHKLNDLKIKQIYVWIIQGANNN